jgi:dTMP kinase
VPGLFVTLEGIEGSGKSTQAVRLAESLTRLGHPVLRTREPGGTPLAERIRHVVLDAKQEPVHPETELLLFLAARAQHVRAAIRPALDEGRIVVCDRFTDATLAYQGGGRGVDPASLRSLCEWAVAGLWPDRTYLLDIPVDIGIARAGERPGGFGVDRMERQGKEFLESVRKEYLQIAQAHPNRITVLDGVQNADSLAETILSDVKSRLAGR